MNNKSGAAQQAVSLPKGGGAIKGIGETFQANLFSGTGTHSIPIATSPGRHGFGPSLSIQYSAGKGNGIFGLGWDLSIPTITRKTEKGLPQYNGADIFVLSGAEDLVPYLKKLVDPTTNAVTWQSPDPIPHPTHEIIRYRPRTEGLFARIEQWTHKTTGEIYWRAISKDNVTNIYGRSAASRLADPDDPSRVYQWLLEESHDAFGNYVMYEYAADDPVLYSHEEPALGANQIFEHNRKATQLYIRRIYYGNLPSPLVDEEGSPITYSNGAPVGALRDGRRYAFEVVFDYGDWDLPTRQPHPAPPSPDRQELFGPDPSFSSQHNPVPVREDRFSTFRSGFEIRTLRRCRRALMFHHFAELGGPTLVRSTDFSYHTDSDTRLSLLSEATVTSYRKDDGAAYQSAAMPPVTFSYTQFRPHEQRYRSIEARGDDMPPFSLKNPDMALVDLFGDGLPDAVISGSDGMRYWRNLGGGMLDRPRRLCQVPAAVAFHQAGVGFGDIGGDGHTDLLVHSGPLPGFYETTAQGTWQTFKPYRSFPGFDIADPNVRLVDLTGDGRSDALMTEAEHFVWFECLGEDGFAPPRYVARRHDLDQFPDVFFDDPAGRVRLADMTGDGLNDIVLVHDGRVDYWPNLGYGRFGRRITMANAPRFGMDFDPKRLFLADLTGTGGADLAYVDFDRVQVWFNQSGNVWSNRETILGTPLAIDAAALQFADVFGTGTATLVWSEDFAAQPESHYKALDFCGGIKPYVLNEMSNNMGVTTKVRYAPSTKYALEDLANGSPWITSLPFPVQVVDTVEVIDHISRTKLVTTYHYHHGYYDGREREFRGFGRVDQFDTERFESFSQPGLHGSEVPFLNGEAAYYVPPVETRSWFHTGLYVDQDAPDDGSEVQDYRELSERYRGEFYRDDTEAVPLLAHDVASGETPYEAYRALRGAVLRTEIYARDGSPKENHPYQVTEGRYRVREIQPADVNRHAVYFSHPLESVTYHYERNPADPRISHGLTLEVDEFGHPLRTLAIGYGRRRPDPALPTQADWEKQTRTFLTYSENEYTNKIDDPETNLNHYRLPLPCESRTYELTGFKPRFGGSCFSLDEWTENSFARLANATVIPYEAAPDPAEEQRRLVEHVRTRYRQDDLSGLLALKILQSLALPGETYKLALTPGLLSHVYGTRVAATMMEADGGYVHSEGDSNWWAPSERSLFSPNSTDTPAQELSFAQGHFFLPCRSLDAFGNSSSVRYDPYDILPTTNIDPVGNRIQAEHDYRLLQPRRVTDQNGNRSEVAFDTLGLVVGTAVMGKATENLGDSLAGLSVDLTSQQRQEFLAHPLASSASLLKEASTRIIYDLHRFREAGQPVFVATLMRETHANDPLPSDGLKIQVSFSYADGFGRAIQRKIQAEAGPVDDGGPSIDVRWVASGWTIFNNKGKPVKEYEPFFDDTHEVRLRRHAGVGSMLFYDPLDRVAATLHPNHTWQKIIFDPWRRETWDVNDTLLIDDPKTDPDAGGFFARLAGSAYLPTWHGLRTDPTNAALFGAQYPDDRSRTHETHAAEQTELHAGTPSTTYLDSINRIVLTVSHNRFVRGGGLIDERYVTRIAYTIEGRQREVFDAKDRLVIRYDYDMLGTRIHHASMEAGERWALSDAAGQPIYSWDDRQHRFRTIYDAARRHVGSFLQSGASPEVQIGRTSYGESQPNPEAGNQRGMVVQHCDQAGIITTALYDFKGNVLESTRHLSKDYKTVLDWSGTPELDTETFIVTMTYDALNRTTTARSPDGSVHRTVFNEANLPERVDVNMRGAHPATPFVTNVDYNAKGQRTLIEYGNGVRTTHEYDPLTYRLVRLTTMRGSQPVQDCRYTYDPAGNRIHVRDDAQQTLYFGNQVVTPDHGYEYDAVYRLVGADGREHIGQAARPETTWNDEFRVKLPHPQNGQAMRRYTERYEYDAAGNIDRMVHRAIDGNWTRRYEYNETSSLDPARQNNRLSRTVVGHDTGDQAPESYSYDAHGNMLAMDHLSGMTWDFRDQLRQVNLAGGGDAFYRYDTGGRRVRKIIEKNGGTLVDERIYLGAFELFRRRTGSGNPVLEQETLHVMDDKQRIALVETTTVDAQRPAFDPRPVVRFQYGDHVGSASLELDGAGQIISYEEYYPYGGTAYQAVTGGVEVSSKRYRYQAMERDDETGLNYHRARYYAPWLGRWASSDPIGIGDGLNTFSSFHCNPVYFKDSSGQDNTPQNFVEYAASVEEGLTRMAKLGLENSTEYGLAQDPKSKKLMILQGSTREVHFGKLIPLGHSHTGEDTTSGPSWADLDEFKRKGVKEHWIFGAEDGWARIRYDKKTNTFDILKNRGEHAVRYTVFPNPDFDPKDKTPLGESKRWKSSVDDVKGTFTVEPPEMRKAGLSVPPEGFSWGRWGARFVVGVQVAAIATVMWSRYAKSLQKDAADHTGGAQTLQLIQNDVTAYAIAEGVAALGPGPRRAVGAAGTFFVAMEVSKLIFGEDDTLRADPNTGREIRWLEIDDPVSKELGMHTYTPHVQDVKTKQWAPAMQRCWGPYSATCAYVTDREYQEITDPWR